MVAYLASPASYGDAASVVRALVVDANLLPDQLPMATSSGVDAIVISEAHALRCREPQWRLKAQGGRFGYQRATARNLSSDVG